MQFPLSSAKTVCYHSQWIRGRCPGKWACGLSTRKAPLFSAPQHSSRSALSYFILTKCGKVGRIRQVPFSEVERRMRNGEERIPVYTPQARSGVLVCEQNSKVGLLWPLQIWAPPPAGRGDEAPAPQTGCRPGTHVLEKAGAQGWRPGYHYWEGFQK